MDHFLIQLKWKTVQHSSQAQTFDRRPSSLVQMGHSYKLWAMSSWMRVAISSAMDFVVTFWGVGGAFGLALPLPFADVVGGVG